MCVAVDVRKCVCVCVVVVVVVDDVDDDVVDDDVDDDVCDDDDVCVVEKTVEVPELIEIRGRSRKHNTTH
ncbi:hypothetical protein TNCV_438541 [Trichonephila clavipes]|nr:hypothetical protein TNCV_438541 [Trichonephila clavipes]